MSRFIQSFPIFTAFFFLATVANAQEKPPAQVNDIFFSYVVKTLELKPEEAVQMRPLAKKYLIGKNRISKTVSDPLEREQQVLSLKIETRKQMTPVIGMERANTFFASEQTFRRKVREELNRRNRDGKKN